jgi:transcriptional accessory protein Tex/SPT6
VSNVTDFGAFVDIGLGKDGLLHVRWERGIHILNFQ